MRSVSLEEHPAKRDLRSATLEGKAKILGRGGRYAPFEERFTRGALRLRGEANKEFKKQMTNDEQTTGEPGELV